MTKLNEDVAEALKYCATADFKLIENIPESKQASLTEDEKSYIARWTGLGQDFQANFKGKSLCFTQETAG